jgi:regulatory protein
VSEDGDGAGAALDDVLARCYRALGRRDHSVAELRARLTREALDPSVIEDALAIVREQGYLDDVRYARLLVEDRRTIAGWGTERIRGRLEAAGIDRDTIDDSLRELGGPAELTAAVELLRRRCRLPLADARGRQRAWSLLVRQGFDSELAYDAVRAVDRAA